MRRHTPSVAKVPPLTGITCTAMGKKVIYRIWDEGLRLRAWALVWAVHLVAPGSLICPGGRAEIPAPSCGFLLVGDSEAGEGALKREGAHLPFFHRQYQLNSPWPAFFCASIAKIRYLVLFSYHLCQGSRRADLILLCDVNRLLAIDWPVTPLNK